MQGRSDTSASARRSSSIFGSSGARSSAQESARVASAISRLVANGIEHATQINLSLWPSLGAHLKVRSARYPRGVRYVSLGTVCPPAGQVTV